MDKIGIRLVVQRAASIIAGIFLLSLTAVLIFVDLPYAMKEGIISGFILDILFSLLLLAAGGYCFYLAVRRRVKNNKDSS